MSLAPSSPRLPSPPPAAEIQITPSSPSGGPAATLHATEMEQSLIDALSKRRIHPGTKSADMAAGPPLVPLNELDSAFQLQEHLAALHYHHTDSNTQPLTRTTAIQLAQPPPGIDRTLWLYELCRFLISQCNSLIVGFLFDTPPCSANTCPEMRASEWQFLCAVHEQPKSCCAIDYCCHTLDWAANVVSDQKLFPSRFVVLHDAHSKNVGVKSLVNVFRRLHRIFAHAWFQHRSVFWSVEGQSGLYVFFKTVCDLYDLLPAENYKLPPEAEGLEAPASEPEPEQHIPAILKPNSQQSGRTNEEDSNFHQVGRTNTRRHIRSSPSTGSAVTTVMEADEEDADGVSRKLQNMHLSASKVSDEQVATEVPVIVEGSAPTATSSHQDTPEMDSKPQENEQGDETVLEVEPSSSATDDERKPSTEPVVSSSEVIPSPEATTPSPEAEKDQAKILAGDVAGDGENADAAASAQEPEDPTETQPSAEAPTDSASGPESADEPTTEHAGTESEKGH